MAIYQLCQLMPGTGQKQAGTSRDKAGTRRGQSGTMQGQTGTNRDSPFLSLLVPVCPSLSMSVPVCPCLSFSVPICPRRSLSVPVCIYICYTSNYFPSDGNDGLYHYEQSYIANALRNCSSNVC